MPKSHQQGFSLLLVLSMSAVLALIGSAIATSGRTEALIARNLANRAAAELAADGAIRAAIFTHLTRQDSSSIAQSRHSFMVGGISVNVHVEEQASRTDPNRASAAALTTVIAKAGIDGEAAPQIAFAIIAYRQRPATSPGVSGFGSIDDLAKVPGLTESIVEHLRPFLAISAPDSDLAGEGQPLRIIIRAVAEAAAGSRAIRHATVRLTPNNVRNQYQILTWETIED